MIDLLKRAAIAPQQAQTMNTGSERHARERLGVCLARLAALTAEDLTRAERARSFFRSALPYFDRTLDLFRRLGQADLRNLPPESLAALADDAEKTLTLFHEILGFRADKVENPRLASAALIAAVRDAYEPMLQRLAPLIQARAGEWERPRQPRRGVALAIALGITAIVVAGALIGREIVGHSSPAYSMLANKVLSALR